ncbi:hypothetical protein LWI28_007168 [Acer negundo]|uniref:Uncharacterized protein n=1 Tax=Acer negundo TaxID=4023 RepID=A0AAD5NPR9_ACENE|nr:hypothetical protein LWI28_007168 [Acer negundo]
MRGGKRRGGDLGVKEKWRQRKTEMGRGKFWGDSNRPLSHSLSNLPILSLSVKSADPHPPSPPRPFSTAAAAEILFHHFLKDLTFEFDRVRQSDSVEI